MGTKGKRMAYARESGDRLHLGNERIELAFNRADGALVSVYYFNTKDDAIQQNGGVRHIAATIWRP